VTCEVAFDCKHRAIMHLAKIVVVDKEAVPQKLEEHLIVEHPLIIEA
jgi:hypothetical protein